MASRPEANKRWFQGGKKLILSRLISPHPPSDLSAQVKMLYSPQQYGSITAPEGESHVTRGHAFGGSLPPPASNPSGGAPSPAALSCITGNENMVLCWD